MLKIKAVYNQGCRNFLSIQMDKIYEEIKTYKLKDIDVKESKIKDAIEILVEFVDNRDIDIFRKESRELKNLREPNRFWRNVHETNCN